MPASTPALFENAETGPFDGDELRDLIERAAQMQAVTEHPGWVYLHDYVIALAAKHQAYVLAGSCSDQLEYVRRTSLVRGMLDVLNAPARVAEQVERYRELSRPEEEE